MSDGRAEIQRVSVCVRALARAHAVIKPLRMEFHEAALKFAEPRRREKERKRESYTVRAGAFCCPGGL